MKSTIKVVPLLAIVFLISAAGHVSAQSEGEVETNRRYFGSSDQELGIIIGEPTGLSFKAWLGTTTAVDFGVAWSFKDDGHLHLHGDYLLHNFGFFDVDQGEFPYYIGIGGRVRFDDDDSRIGIRLVMGAEYYHASMPLGFFFELVPVFDLAPETEMDINGGVGIRYVF